MQESTIHTNALKTFVPSGYNSFLWLERFFLFYRHLFHSSSSSSFASFLLLSSFPIDFIHTINMLYVSFTTHMKTFCELFLLNIQRLRLSFTRKWYHLTLDLTLVSSFNATQAVVSSSAFQANGSTLRKLFSFTFTRSLFLPFLFTFLRIITWLGEVNKYSDGINE